MTIIIQKFEYGVPSDLGMGDLIESLDYYKNPDEYDHGGRHLEYYLRVVYRQQVGIYTYRDVEVFVLTPDPNSRVDRPTDSMNHMSKILTRAMGITRGKGRTTPSCRLQGWFNYQSGFVDCVPDDALEKKSFLLSEEALGFKIKFRKEKATRG